MARKTHWSLQKNGGLADLWYMDDGDIVRHPILVPFHLHEFDVANAQSWSGAEPTETGCCHLLRESIPLGVAVGTRQFVTDQLSMSYAS